MLSCNLLLKGLLVLSSCYACYPPFALAVESVPFVRAKTSRGAIPELTRLAPPIRLLISTP